ncbi:hypothetical protein NIASO_11405 [Niabella soli DSM 19437]|uniref:Uncharacterized protein n=1 Tax=Niabella soli DSM 19437 TaxID=929713 RepID=W0F8D9_9BACT|nr:hypothetical protein NIASO_11405 [Niabella soli DSM 19437]
MNSSIAVFTIYFNIREVVHFRPIYYKFIRFVQQNSSIAIGAFNFHH